MLLLFKKISSFELNTRMQLRSSYVIVLYSIAAFGLRNVECAGLQTFHSSLKCHYVTFIRCFSQVV